MAVVLATSIALLKIPAATAQSSTSSGFDCPSGIYSSVDGSCVDSSQSGYTDQLNSLEPGSQSPGAFGSNAAGAGGQFPSGQMMQQYPGLQSYGMNGSVPIFRDSSGLPISLAQQQAIYQERALALQAATPPAPTEFQRMVRASLGSLLPVYGDSLFSQVPSTFAPLRDVPVTPDYVVGPGDQLVVRIWGQVNFNAQVTVDRSGSIYLPQVGEIHVAGLPYSQVQDHVRQDVARIYKNFNVSVEMGQLRSIQVFVVGQARRPGTYTLSSLSTLVTALFATGGPSVQGSLRDIQLKRNGQIVTHFDLYDLLINGDKSKDASLLSGDIIYIPPVGPQVAAGGSVRNPAVYELKGQTSVSQLLAFAGGLSTTASVLRASLERVDDHRARQALDITLVGAGLETPLRQGDILNVLPISPQFVDTVTLRGNVAVPGRFGWHEGMKLSDIIPDSQSLITRDYWERRNQLGIPGPEFKPEYTANPDLYQRGVQRYTNVPGNAPASTPQGTAAQPQGSNAMGSTPNAVGFGSSQISPAEAADALTQQSQAQQTSQAGTQNPNTPESSPGSNSSVSAEDQLQWRGGMLPRPPLNVSLTVPEIDWSYAVIERLNPQTLATSLVPFNPGALVLEHDPSQDLLLEPGDVVTIFSQADIRVPQAQRTKYIRLAGEFKHAGIYSAQPGETLRQLVIRAGGLTPDAYLYGSSFTRESTRAIQQVRLDDYVLTLQQNIDRATIAAAANGLDVGSSATTASRNLVTRFQAVRATGRIVLSMAPHAAGIDSLPDFPLEDGDTFSVPPRPATVNVVGAVYDQNSFIFQQSRTVGGYLQLAGGPMPSADRGQAFIIRADGSVISRSSQSGVFGNTFASERLNPGDTLVVPEKVPKPSFLRNFQTYSSLFSSLALGVAAIAVLQ